MSHGMLYNPSAFDVIRECFPGTSQDEVQALCDSINQGERWNDKINGSQFLSDCLKHLTSKGYVFGCGTKNGCPPGCHC